VEVILKNRTVFHYNFTFSRAAISFSGSAPTAMMSGVTRLRRPHQAPLCCPAFRRGAKWPLESAAPGVIPSFTIHLNSSRWVSCQGMPPISVPKTIFRCCFQRFAEGKLRVNWRCARSRCPSGVFPPPNRCNRRRGWGNTMCLVWPSARFANR